MLKCLQAGRALAAMAVVAFHLTVDLGDPRYGVHPVAGYFSRHGNLGVDFFFVLSGFIILNAHAKDVGRPKRWLTYIWRRFARVYPIYWLYLSIMCVFLLMGAAHTNRAPADFAAWLSAYSLIRFSPAAPPLLVAWTLFHEIAFYVVFSSLILNRWLGVGLLTAWGASCVALYHYTGTSGFSAFSVYTSAYNLEFFCGMAAFGLYRRGKNAGLLAGAGLAILLGAWALIQMTGWVEHGLFGVGFGLLISGATILEAAKKIRTPALLVSIGGASYTLYLVHGPIDDAALKLIGISGLGPSIPPLLLWWTLFLVTVAVAWLAWRVVEQPLQVLLGRGGGAARPPAPLPAG